jgi:hypothetical protein
MFEKTPAIEEDLLVNKKPEYNTIVYDTQDQKNDTEIEKKEIIVASKKEITYQKKPDKTEAPYKASVDSGEKQDWEKVLFDLRRAKFGKMVLGALLRNVEVPKKIDDKLILKFKSKSLHDHFKAEWQLDLAREAVKKAVTEVYGNGIKLVLEEPDEEQKNNPKSNLLESDIVKSALAMGAKVEEEREE